MLIDMLNQVVALKRQSIRLMLIDSLLDLSVEFLIIKSPGSLNQLLNLSVIVVLNTAIIIVKIR